MNFFCINGQTNDQSAPRERDRHRQVDPWRTEKFDVHLNLLKILLSKSHMDQLSHFEENISLPQLRIKDLKKPWRLITSNLLSKAGIPYVSDRWFLSSAWTIDSINCVFHAKTNWVESCQSCVNTHPGLFDFSEFPGTNKYWSASLCLQWNNFLGGLLSLFKRKKKSMFPSFTIILTIYLLYIFKWCFIH